MFSDHDVISRYTRADAIADGELVDVTDTAKQAGFKYPVALTRSAWTSAVEWTAHTAERSDAVQDKAGRLWDVVYMASLAVRAAARKNHDAGDATLFFTVYVVPSHGRSVRPCPMRLRLTLDGGDDGMGAFLISLPEDDL